MASDTPLTDDFIVELLKKEALQDTTRYIGDLGRPRSNAPKLNTRFLRNVMRDTDSHNTALRAREDAESRARLRDTRHDEGYSRDSRRTYEPGRQRYGRLSRSRSPEGRNVERERTHRKRPRDEGERESRRRRQSRSHPQSTSPPRRRDRDHSQDRRQRRERSTSRNRRQIRERSTSRRRRDRRDRERDKSPAPRSYDSDSNEVPIGPQLPSKILPRGRGANKTSSIDKRFDIGYDPAVDVPLDLDKEGNDWDMALNALRDRAKWRKTHAERLRAAGFSDDAVQGFVENSSSKDASEKDTSNIKWVKRGEGREWDRGKVMDGNKVNFVPAWNRPKEP